MGRNRENLRDRRGGLAYPADWPQGTDDRGLPLYWLLPTELVLFPLIMTTKTPYKPRRHKRIALPKGMTVAWYGSGDSQVSRVKTLGMGGLFLAAPAVRPVGTTLTLLFEVPGGFVQAQGVVRSIAPGEGMGVEFTNVGPQARALLDGLLQRLLQ